VAFERAHALDPADREIALAFAGTRNNPRALYAELRARSVEPWAAAYLDLLLALLDEVGERGACRLEGPLEPQEAKLRVREGQILTEIEIGGRTAKAALDTGAWGIIVPERLVEKARLVELGTTRYFGLGASQPAEARIVLADAVVGGLSFTACEVVVWPETPPGAEGLVGIDLFGNFLATLDFPGRRLRLSPLPALPPPASPEIDPWWDHDRPDGPPTGGFVAARVVAGKFLLPVRASGPGGEKYVDTYFLLDSGAHATILGRHLAERLTRVVPSNLEMRGAAGPIPDVYQAEDVTLQVAGFRQRHRGIVTIDFAELNRSIGVEVGGLLGWDTLQHLMVGFDWRNGLVRLERPKPAKKARVKE
jgi:predicted aspartyl protease